MRQLEAFRSASDLLADPDALRERFMEDGYLFLPGLLATAQVLAVREAILATLAGAGWLEDGSDPSDARPGRMRTDQDPDWRDGYGQVLAVEDVNRLPHDPTLTAVVGDLVGDPVVVHPQKIPRITFPGSEYPTLPHQDFVLIQRSGDTLTAWLPLGDCPSELGGLRVLAGSHREGLRPVREADGVGGVTAEGVDPGDPRWRSIDHYRPGDVLLFHCMTVHEAPANRGGSPAPVGRLPVPVRQGPDRRRGPAPDRVLRAWPELWNLTKGWSSTQWCEVAPPVRLGGYGADPLSTPASRLAGFR